MNIEQHVETQEIRRRKAKNIEWEHTSQSRRVCRPGRRELLWLGGKEKKKALKGHSLSFTSLSMSHCWADTMGLTSRGVELKGWTRTTANSKQALLSGEHAGLRIPAQLRTQWALMTDSRPAITQGGRNFGDRELIHGQRARSSLTLRYAGSPRRPQFALCGFSWHCVLGEKSVGMLLQQSSGWRGCALLLCGGKT